MEGLVRLLVRNGNPKMMINNSFSGRIALLEESIPLLKLGLSDSIN